MASFNSALFLGLLVGISAFMAAPSSVEAQIFSGLLNLIRINGIVPCAVNGTTPVTNSTGSVNGTMPVNNSTGSLNGTIPANTTGFANASLQLRCGNINLGSTTTNATGGFQFLINPLQNILAIVGSLLPGGTPCNIVVVTPLSQCNSSLPTSGSLVAPLAGLIGNIAQISPFRLLGGGIN